MNHREFKLGDIVRCVSNDLIDMHCKNKIGRIIDIDDDLDYPYFIEFFKPEHDGSFDDEEIKLYDPILKTFLKEKQDES